MRVIKAVRVSAMAWLAPISSAGQILEIHHSAPARQTLRDTLHDHELLASREDDRISSLLYLDLQMPEEAGCELNFVDRDG
jgi:hypothetical protein